jgi:hypothetical protein
MNSYRCKICDKPDHFWFKWSTSRYFDRKRVLEVIKKNSRFITSSDRDGILNGDYRVCGECCDKFQIMKKNSL